MKKIIPLLLIVIILMSGCASTKITRVNINTNVPGARVIVDGRLLGTTPLESVEMRNKLGKKYPIVIEMEGYQTFRGNLNTERKTGAQTAVVIGGIFYFLILPMLLWININYLDGPVPNQYFSLDPME